MGISLPGQAEALNFSVPLRKKTLSRSVRLSGFLVDSLQYRSPRLGQRITNSFEFRIGVCTKCDFCSSQMDEAIKRGLKPGQDPEATPACVRYCISEALHFGDMDDPESTVSSLIRKNKTVCLNDELGTDPSVYYIVG